MMLRACRTRYLRRRRQPSVHGEAVAVEARAIALSKHKARKARLRRFTALQAKAAIEAIPMAASSVVPSQPTNKVSATAMAVKDNMDMVMGHAKVQIWRIPID